MNEVKHKHQQKEIHIYSPVDSYSQHRAELMKQLLKERGYRVTQQTNIASITIIGSKLTIEEDTNDRNGNQDSTK